MSPLGRLFSGRGTALTRQPVPAVLGAAGVACCLAAARRRPGRIAMAAAGTVLLANAGVYLHTTLRGKLRIWERELDRAGLHGNEQLLDLGCGRGAVLIAAARRLPDGTRRRRGPVDKGPERQQSRSHARQRRRGRGRRPGGGAHGRHDRAAVPRRLVRRRDERAGDPQHPVARGRYRAVDEAMRVLRPGGQLLIADPWPMARKYAAHIGQGTLRGLGPGYWYGGPWLGITLLHAVKER